MTVREIVTVGHPVLRERAREVAADELATSEVQQLIDDLVDTMRAANGAGIAANQIGVPLRITTIEVNDNPRYPYKPRIPLTIVVNPIIEPLDDELVEINEGCLSVPGLSFDCRRRQHVVAHGQNMHGDPITVEGTALLARCVQHETDHLDGVLFVDRLDPATRKEAMRAIRAADWGPQAGIAGIAGAARPGGGGPAVKLSPHPTLGGRF